MTARWRLFLFWSAGATLGLFGWVFWPVESSGGMPHVLVDTRDAEAELEVSPVRRAPSRTQVIEPPDRADRDLLGVGSEGFGPHIEAVLNRGTPRQAQWLLEQLMNCLPANPISRTQPAVACVGVDSGRLKQADELAQKAIKSELLGSAPVFAQWVIQRHPSSASWREAARSALNESVGRGDGNALRFVAEQGGAVGFSAVERHAHGAVFEAHWGRGPYRDPNLLDPRPLYSMHQRVTAVLSEVDSAQVQAIAWALSRQFPRREAI